MDIIIQRKINILSDIIREKMNSIIEEIDGDFVGWCELATESMKEAVSKYIPEIKFNEVYKGKFKNEGHFWNVIDGVIVDLTIEQFGKYKSGIINKKFLNNYQGSKIQIGGIKTQVDEILDFLYVTW